MSAAGRLWIRAPIWRLSLVTAVTATALAAIFLPPHAQPPSVSTSYQPLTPADVLRRPLRDVVSLLGREIPLPAGEWHPLVAVTGRGQPAIDGYMLVRMDGNHPSGLVVVQGTVADASGGFHVQVHFRCANPDDLAADIIPNRDGVTLECWNMLPRTLPQDWAGTQEGLIYAKGLARMREGGIDPSGTFLGANWFLSDADGLLLVDYFLPASEQAGLPATPAGWSKPDALANPKVMAYLSQVEAWAQAWTPLLESGAAGDLQPSDVQTVSARLKE